MVSKMYNDQSNYTGLDDQIKLLENEINVLEERNSVSAQEVQKLLEYEDAEDEEEYYYYARKHEEYHDNVAKFKELTTKLDEEHFDYDSRNELSRFLLADLNEEEENISTQIEEFNKKIQHEQKVLAEINSEIAA